MVIFGLAAELALGTFRPWNSEYRLAGFVHPNTMAIELTVLAISSYLLGAAYPRRRGLLYAIVACCVVLVVLTRSRTGAACFLVGFAAIWLLHTSLKTKFYSITIAIMIGSAILAALFMVGIDDPESFSNMLLLGRADDPTSFTGRLPIWQTLMDEVRQRPLAGYGWHSYWSDETLDYMADQHEWAIPNAHNGYIEIILGVGYVGMLLLALTMIAGMWEIGRVKSRDRFYALTFALISLGWLHAMLESHMLENFNFAPFLVAAGLLRLAFFEAPPKLAEPPETTLSQEHELALSAYQP
jgi:O-antigen ligase